MISSIPFNPNEPWTQIAHELGNPNAYLAQLYKNLSIPYKNSLFNLKPDPDLKLNNKLSHLLDERKASPAMRSSITEANSYLATYASMYYKLKIERDNGMTTRNYLTDDELLEMHLDRTRFLKCLQQVSEFWCWAYGIVVPDYVKRQYNSISVDVGGPDINEITDEDLTTNRTNRIPILFLIDHNYNMSPEMLVSLKDGVNDLVNEIAEDPVLEAAAELCLISCCGDRNSNAKPVVWREFDSVVKNNAQFINLDYKRFGCCRMSEAINLGLDQLNERLGRLDHPDVAISWFRPWIIIISDGQFKVDEALEDAAKRLQYENIRIGLKTYVRSLSRKGPFLENLHKIAPDVHHLDSVSGFFKDVFNSMLLITGSTPGGEDNVILGNRHGFYEAEY